MNSVPLIVDKALYERAKNELVMAIQLERAGVDDTSARDKLLAMILPQLYIQHVREDGVL
jgi:hypothetical protein